MFSKMTPIFRYQFWSIYSVNSGIGEGIGCINRDYFEGKKPNSVIIQYLLTNISVDFNIFILIFPINKIR